MADTKLSFTQVFLTYREVRTNNPQWTEEMIEDYLSLKRDLLTVSNTGDDVVNALSNAAIDATVFDLKNYVGTADKLTSDETGFTVDSIKLTVDMTHAHPSGIE